MLIFTKLFESLITIKKFSVIFYGRQWKLKIIWKNCSDSEIVSFLERIRNLIICSLISCLYLVFKFSKKLLYFYNICDHSYDFYYDYSSNYETEKILSIDLLEIIYFALIVLEISKRKENGKTFRKKFCPTLSQQIIYNILFGRG